MALFSKPPAKKPAAAKATDKSAGTPPRVPVSARDVAAQAQAHGRRGNAERPRAEPATDLSMAAASLIEMTPARAPIEVGSSSPGLCAVVENAALLFASGQVPPARALLAEGVANDHDARSSALAWLCLFDLLQRQGDRVAFDDLALQYVVQFERSAPAWEERGATATGNVERGKATAGGYAVLTGKLTAATAPQIDGVRRSLDKGGPVRLDLAQVAGFDDAGARLLADTLAYARQRRVPITIQRGDKLQAALDILLRRGRDAGEGAWLLALEVLQFGRKQEAFDDRAIEYAVAFEQSPPSWEPPLEVSVPAPIDDTASALEAEAAPGDPLTWSGVMAGACAPATAAIAEHATREAVVVLDMAAVQRVDFVCAGALLNAINRVEAQRKTVQIVGATPIIRALLLLIGISPRHFVRKLP
ncbi:MAG: STAS domain-containing protein [Burkholderiales bacterium]|nr:STAS domain-containing protein [Burkholderiales bacterium]